MKKLRQIADHIIEKPKSALVVWLIFLLVVLSLWGVLFYQKNQKANNKKNESVLRPAPAAQPAQPSESQINNAPKQSEGDPPGVDIPAPTNN